MSGIKSARPLILVAIFSVILMFYTYDKTLTFISAPIIEFVPYVTISLIFIIILNLAMRQALTMYVASIIALITSAHFYIFPNLTLANEELKIFAETKHLLSSFIILLPVFGLVKIPAHKVLKSLIYLLGSLISWIFFSYVIAKMEAPTIILSKEFFSAIAMVSPFNDFWLSPLQSILICISGVILLFMILRNAHNIYLMAIAIIASFTIAHMSSQTMILFATLASTICLCSAIISSRKMAFNDELTGIPGRRSMVQYAEELGPKFAVVMIDIDFFKKFNDKYGHESGDDVIKLVASKIARTGNRAKAFRYGGEEFTLVFDGRSMDDIRETIEDLRVAIESYPMAIRTHHRAKKSAVEAKHRRQKPDKKDIVRVTCSFGIAESMEGSKDFKAALKRADTALYKAKKGGRNCVRTA
ncbi:GGDEF domain-containing protein [Glaciecola sp. MF2-115]|uniref:GGDEF domain-containing protein n=1 Tax=Glaciecola sp. MF2-115 TaxID=3384827 RepID=UPI00399F9CDB